ncbi:tRNA threonylcarbamoyladenosine dehydratase [Pelistega europaea]|uniref:tRNA threonylcarbamoyladenosine dehydratase n=1 Tax=Pelistega europaea TaxID=106147 RepID=A0A7Y4P638_9BURK|nr:tRNA threonylcarbamoyladenosine dehydratase [Pelistega europaea]NOL49514.1 tRNA threonylcarbamoyladenosine dehydratase [Pelistega europaea]
MMKNETTSITRRFNSLQRLYGEKATEQLAQSHVFIAGIGGVGSWAVEALARSGVGELTLADLDHVAESNINRQVHALSSTIGKAKIEAMAERIYEINPLCKVNLIDDFVDADNIESYLNQYKADVLLDCTDQVKAKVAMLLAARSKNIPFFMCGGAGGKTDVFSLQYTDLAYVKQDNLLGRIRQILRKEYDYPKGSDKRGKALKNPPKMGVKCVWFDQKARLPDLWINPDQAPQGLSCAGYGSSVVVTSSMGMAVANLAIAILLSNSD